MYFFQKNAKPLNKLLFSQLIFVKVKCKINGFMKVDFSEQYSQFGKRPYLIYCKSIYGYFLLFQNIQILLLQINMQCQKLRLYQCI